ncbi:transposase, IS605 OrfB family [Nitrosococcus halophilus Nc 4]|uniref:Transposase, IS605 OrfB family n=1 Tax=Nitrosococcus halophilus (strain Nc4) TaxID=472759 RepID=D5BWT0_NITHN|nr:RNA-guided endonuclease TnpB family protein [Nitrosococcus halophilus]ADE13811.1 transposase, IS605 OrfB family [Nitrosococcus halophilus Nc 4]
MLLAHKIELRPSISQAAYLGKACGSRRHCYNKLLEHFSKDENKWSKAAAYQHYIKVIRPEFPWYNEVSSRVTRNAIDDLDNAFKHFFRRVKKGEKPGFPKFKKKDINDSFALRERTKFEVKGRKLSIEKLKTLIPMRQRLRFEGTPKQVTISKRAGKYFASILVDTEDYKDYSQNRAPSVGVDFGVKSLAVASDGQVFPANNKLKRSLKKLKRLSRHLSRKKKGSNRRAIAKQRLAKLHYRIAKQRSAVLHELSHQLTASYDRIALEDLNVKGMVKNRKLARSIVDAGFAMLRQFIEYKAYLRGCTVERVDRFFPSSKMCSGCGQLHDITLADRALACDCGLTIDRDLNAAINLNQYRRDTLKPDVKRTQESSKTALAASVLTV